MKVNTGHKIYEMQLEQCFKRNVYQSKCPLKRKEKSQINNLTFHFKKLKKKIKLNEKEAEENECLDRKKNEIENRKSVNNQ